MPVLFRGEIDMTKTSGHSKPLTSSGLSLQAQVAQGQNFISDVKGDPRNLKKVRLNYWEYFPFNGLVQIIITHPV